MRVLMLAGVKIDVDGGGHQDFREDSIYLVDRALGQEWKSKGLACDPNLPPEDIAVLKAKANGTWIDQEPVVTAAPGTGEVE